MGRDRRARRWLVVVVVACAALLAAGLGYVALRGSTSEVVDEAGRAGWKVIAYEGVRIDVPAAWERVDQDDCEFQFERWGPPGTRACEYAGGVAFYASATFDPGHRPGVRRGESPDEPAWGGYAYAGEYAVYASDDERNVVVRILRSAEPSA